MGESLVSRNSTEFARGPTEYSRGRRSVFLTAQETVPKPIPEFRHVSNWEPRRVRRREVANRITLAARVLARTRALRSQITVEGQTPDSLPDTLDYPWTSRTRSMSTSRASSAMGGTGALRFCGRHNLQLVISRRNPTISSPSTRLTCRLAAWGFTVVRREDPTGLEAGIDATDTWHRDQTVSSVSPFGLPCQFSPRETGLTVERLDQPRREALRVQAAGKSHILRGDGLAATSGSAAPANSRPVRLPSVGTTVVTRAALISTLNGLGVRLSDDRSDRILSQGSPPVVRSPYVGADDPPKYTPSNVARLILIRRVKGSSSP